MEWIIFIILVIAVLGWLIKKIIKGAVTVLAYLLALIPMGIFGFFVFMCMAPMLNELFGMDNGYMISIGCAIVFTILTFLTPDSEAFGFSCAVIVLLQFLLHTFLSDLNILITIIGPLAVGWIFIFPMFRHLVYLDKLEELCFTENEGAAKFFTGVSYITSVLLLICGTYAVAVS